MFKASPNPPPPLPLPTSPSIKGGQDILFLLRSMFQFCPSSVLQKINNRKIRPSSFHTRSNFVSSYRDFEKVAIDVYKKGLMSHLMVWSKNAGGKAKHDQWLPVIVGRISRSTFSGETVEAMLSSAQTFWLLRFLILRPKLRQSNKVVNNNTIKHSFDSQDRSAVSSEMLLLQQVLPVGYWSVR